MIITLNVTYVPESYLFLFGFVFCKFSTNDFKAIRIGKLVKGH